MPHPYGFSFADAVAADIGLSKPPDAVPFAVSFRVNAAPPDGTYIAVWRRGLAVGRALPTIPLALTVREAVVMDLEYTYREAARRAYLD